MYNDILGNEDEIKKPTKENILKAMKDNIKEKDKFIEQLVDKITELERQVEDLNL